MSSADFVLPVRGRRQRIWSALVKTYDDLDRHNYLYYAGSLSFFFLLSLFPLMIFLTSLFAFLPIPQLSEQTLEIMGRIVPTEAMGVLRGVANDVVRTNPKLLSFGIAWAVVGAMWTADRFWLHPPEQDVPDRSLVAVRVTGRRELANADAMLPDEVVPGHQRRIHGPFGSRSVRAGGSPQGPIFAL